MQGTALGGRFKSQALLDEKALLACMAYVDLNPIRAGLSDTLEESDYTSIQERILAYLKSREGVAEAASSSPVESTPAVSSERGTKGENGDSTAPTAPLLTFTGTGEEVKSGLPFHFSDCLELVDWTGRAVRADMRGFIPADVPPIQRRLGIEAGSWIETVRHFRWHFYDFVGPADVLAQHSQALGHCWLRGVGACRRLLSGGESAGLAAGVG